MIVIHVARKPLRGSSPVTAMSYGVGGLNVDACRIGTTLVGWGGGGGGLKNWHDDGVGMKDGAPRPVVGRWPANLILEHTSECVYEGLREVSVTKEQILDCLEPPDSARVPVLVDQWVCSNGCPARDGIGRFAPLAPAFFLQTQSGIKR